MKGYKTKLLLHKRYFDLGYGITSYLKYIIAIFGLTSQKLLITMIIALCYGLFCYSFGWLFVKYGWFTADLEITNNFNLFVREMRKKIK